MSISQQKINYKDRSYRVAVDLMDVLEVNTRDRFVRCEPMVTIGRLTQILLDQGWMVPIVPEIGEGKMFQKCSKNVLILTFFEVI